MGHLRHKSSTPIIFVMVGVLFSSSQFCFWLSDLTTAKKTIKHINKKYSKVQQSLRTASNSSSERGSSKRRTRALVPGPHQSKCFTWDCCRMLNSNTALQHSQTMTKNIIFTCFSSVHYGQYHIHFSAYITKYTEKKHYIVNVHKELVLTTRYSQWAWHETVLGLCLPY